MYYCLTRHHSIIIVLGEITYGGRVTDYWDLRCLKTILKIFFSPDILQPDWVYSKSGIYYCPHFEKLVEYRTFIEGFPIIEEPEIFGMHENANIAFQNKETQTIILTILNSQPRVAGGSAEKSSDEIVFELSETIVERIMKHITTDEALPTLFNVILDYTLVKACNNYYTFYFREMIKEGIYL